MAHDRRKQLSTYTLRFEQFPGLTVRMSQPGLQGLLDIAEATAVLRRSVREGWDDLDVRNLRAWRRLAGAFARSLMSWDLVAGGERVGVRRADVLAQDIDLLIELVRGWQQAINQDIADRRAVEPDGVEDGDAESAADEPDEAGERPYAVGEVFDPENPRLDEEWVAQLPTETLPPQLEVVADA